jgi:tetratricopeptide (TPR) repeat protein
MAVFASPFSPDLPVNIVARDPLLDTQTLRAIQSAAQSGRHAEAAELAEAARAGGLEHPLIYNVLALELESNGRLPEAEAMLQRAVRLAPNDPSSRNALGLCLLRFERPEEALAQFDAVVARQPSLAFAHANRGHALAALRRNRDAELSFRRALDLDPHQGAALAGLAHIESSRGAYAAARRWAEQALQLIPGHPQTQLSLAASELGEHEPRAAESRLRGLLLRDDLEPLLRAYASGLLGDALDAQERTAEAFAAYSLCNRTLRELHAPRFESAPRALDFARELVRVLQRVDREAWRTPPSDPLRTDPASGHVFILGFPRSGTTLLEVVLEGHPQVVSLEEHESLIDGVQEFMRRPEDLERLASAAPERLEALRRSYWRRVADAGIEVRGRVFVDKNPLNTLKLPLIARLFPEARVLFACRDPRDVVLSCFRHRFRMSAPLYELLRLEDGAAYYDAVMRFFIECARVLPLDVSLVRHEDVVGGFEREIQRVCGFLGIEWVPAMRDIARRTERREILTPSAAQLARGLNRKGVGRWQRYREPLQPVLPLLAPWIGHFHYDP